MEPLFTPHSSHCIVNHRHTSTHTPAHEPALSEICGTFHLPENPSESELWVFQISLPVAHMAELSNQKGCTGQSHPFPNSQATLWRAAETLIISIIFPQSPKA